MCVCIYMDVDIWISVCLSLVCKRYKYFESICSGAPPPAADLAVGMWDPYREKSTL